MISEESIERSMVSFRGDRSREVEPNEFVESLSDILGLSLLRDAARIETGRAPAAQKSYGTNEEFWMDSIRGRHREGLQIRLEGFHLMEWIPYSPGRYHTQEAAEARERAKKYSSYTKNEYLPLGKQSMMLGGVGSVRLKARTIDGGQYYFLGASSSGISHQGIPLIVPESEYYKVMDTIIEHGGCYTNVLGRLRVMPTELSLISYGNDIPKYFVLADVIEFREKSPSKLLLATASVMYSGSYYDNSSGRDESFELGGFKTKLRKGWTFCSFNPAGGIGAVVSAAEWLKQYAVRYSDPDQKGDPILSDFDEHYQHFETPIEFPIGSIVDRRIDLRRLDLYGQHYGFQIIAQEVHVGNIFSGISNSTIINESQVRDSFNKIASARDEETAQALLRVAEEIDRSGNPAAGALFGSFNAELQKDNANPTVLKTLWDGIVGQLPAIVGMVDVIGKITSLFS